MANKAVESLSREAGIVLGKDIIIYNGKMYGQILQNPSLGLGESFMDAYWDEGEMTIDQIIYKIQRSKRVQIPFMQKIKLSLLHVWSKFRNFQTIKTSKEVALKHYDIGNELYKRMLDKNMIYSCGYWTSTTKDLDTAQLNKLRLICKKLHLKPGMKVLDIGCGWGGLAKFMAERCNVEVVGITISQEQIKYAKEQCSKVNYMLIDYRELPKKYDEYFDAIVSVGMFEHVGIQNYRTFMQLCHRYLKNDGIFLLHTIGGEKDNLVGDPWFNKYIFPNSVVPTLGRIISSSKDIFSIEDVHNFGADYDRTLMAWFDRFHTTFNDINMERAMNKKELLDDRFYRMWKYYLLSSAGAFRSRSLHLYQIVFTKHKDGKYERFDS